MSSNDEIRESILSYLYTVFTQATKIDKAKVRERKIVHALQSNYSTAEIVKNLLYLIQTGWIKKEKTKDAEYYIISDRGVNHFEGSSIFQKSHFMTGININNTQGVIVVGDSNYVHQDFRELFNKLDLLKDEIAKSDLISDQEKISSQSEIETIKSQLAKGQPNKTILEQAWSSLNFVATLPGIVDAYKIVESLIAKISS